MEKIEKFVKDYIQEMKDDKDLIAGEFCIILYRKRGYGINETKHTDKIYKSVSDFAERGVEDIQKIPSEFGIAVECWVFD